MSAFKLRIPPMSIVIGTGFVATLFASVSIVIFVMSGDNKKLKDSLQFGTAAIAAVAGITGAAYVANQLKHSVVSSKTDRTLKYIERWNNPDFDKKAVLALFRETKELGPTEKQKIISDKLENDDELRSELISILNFLEEMSLSIHENLTDERVLRNFFRGIVFDYVETFRCWIKARRERVDNSNLYKQLMDLYERWHNCSC